MKAVAAAAAQHQSALRTAFNRCGRAVHVECKTYTVTASMEVETVTHAVQWPASQRDTTNHSCVCPCREWPAKTTKTRAAAAAAKRIPPTPPSKTQFLNKNICKQHDIAICKHKAVSQDQSAIRTAFNRFGRTVHVGCKTYTFTASMEVETVTHAVQWPASQRDATNRSCVCLCREWPAKTTKTRTRAAAAAAASTAATAAAAAAAAAKRIPPPPPPPSETQFFLNENICKQHDIAICKHKAVSQDQSAIRTAFNRCGRIVHVGCKTYTVTASMEAETVTHAVQWQASQRDAINHSCVCLCR